MHGASWLLRYAQKGVATMFLREGDSSVGKGDSQGLGGAALGSKGAPGRLQLAAADLAEQLGAAGRLSGQEAAALAAALRPS